MNANDRTGTTAPPRDDRGCGGRRRAVAAWGLAALALSGPGTAFGSPGAVVPPRTGGHGLSILLGLSLGLCVLLMLRGAFRSRRTTRRLSRLRGALRSLATGVIQLDTQGRVSETNPAALALLGQVGRDLSGRTLSDLARHFRDACTPVDGAGCALAGGDPDEGARCCQHESKRRGKRRRCCRLTSRPVKAGDGRHLATTLLVEDVTDVRELQERLRDLERAASDDVRSRGTFLSATAGELRSPVNTITGMLALLDETHLSGEQREYLGAATQSARVLLGLLNRLLDFSKYRDDRSALENIDFDLRTTIESTMEALAVPAHRKGLELLCRVAPDLPAWLRGDPGRLRQTLIDLLSRAVEGTDDGDILIQVAAADAGSGETAGEAPADPSSRLLEFVISTPGASVSAAKALGGAESEDGMAAELIGMLGGRLRFERDAAGVPALRFTVRFAKGSERPITADGPVKVDPAAVSVLVVDDNDRSREWLTETVADWGYRASASAGGADALEQLASGRTADILVVDLHMPDMDGFSLTETIRRDLGREGPRIVLLVSAGLRGDVDRCRELDIDAYLTKPVRETDLREALHMVAGGSDRQSGVITRFTLREQRNRLHVLIGSEVEGTRARQLVRLLEKQGHVVDTAKDREAVARALSEQPYDLAFVEDGAVPPEAVGKTGRILNPDTPLPLAALMARAVQTEREKAGGAP